MTKLFKLTLADTNKFAQSLKTNPVNKYLKMREHLNFKVGDILIKKKRGYSSKKEWTVETVSDRSPVPKKYYYAYENEFGVGYIKQIKSDGSTLCESVQCLADIDFEYQMFEVDPDFVDHIVLVGGDEEYVAGTDFKEKQEERNKIHALNRKLANRINTEQEAFDLLKDLKVGDKFWMGSDLYDATKREYTVTKHVIEKVDHMKRYYPTPKLTNIVKLETTYVGGYSGTTNIDSYSAKGVFYLKKPNMYDKTI